MLRLFNSPFFGKKFEDVPAALVAAASRVLRSAREGAEEAAEQGHGPESTLLLTLGWISAGLGAVAVGLFVGRELRQRYKFNRRTPYDLYAHSGGDEVQDIEFGLGI